MTMPNRPAGRAICLSLALWCLFRIACAQVYDSPVAVVQTAEPNLDSPVQKSRSEPSSGSALRFRDLSSEAGLITVPHTTTERRYVVDMMSGGGIALVDCDGDGRLDVVVVNDSSIERYLAGGDRMVTLYHQDGKNGALHFTDVTASSGLDTKGWANGLAVADFDNDGRPDLFVTGYGRNVLYRNLGNCRFEDVTDKAGVKGGGFSTGAAWADYDRDGFVDLYIARYVETDPEHLPDPKGGVYKGVLAEVPDKMPGEMNLLYHNRGDGTFEEVAARAGVQNGRKLHGMGISWGDYDSDGWPDLYVTNDSGYSYLFHNLRDGTFEDVGILSGTAAGEHGQIYGNMAADFGDFDRDGKLDLFVTRYANQPASLYRNQGEGEFRDLADPSGIGRSTIPWVKWGEGFGDFDNDGRLDLVTANGNFSTLLEGVPGEPGFAEPMQLFQSRGDGSFEERADAAGMNNGKLRSRRGLAIGDIDNDGKLDLVVFNVGAPPTLFHNETVNAGHWLGLRLIGQRSNRLAIGARVRLMIDDATMIDEVRGGGSYLSSHDTRLHFGLGKCAIVKSVEVLWPSGQAQKFDNLAADAFYSLTEGQAPVRVPK